MVCRHFGICGGCTIQNLSYPEQLARKEAALVNRLPTGLRGPGGPLASPVFVSTGLDLSAPWCFRQKVAFVFASRPGGSGLVITCAALGLLYSVTRFQHDTHNAIAPVDDPLSGDDEGVTPFDLIRPERATADVEAVSPPALRNVEFV